MHEGTARHISMVCGICFDEELVRIIQPRFLIIALYQKVFEV